MLNDVVIANKTYTKMIIPAGEHLDDIALKVIKADLPEFLLPIKSMDIDGDTEIRYEIVDGLRLEYLPNSMTRKEFVALLAGMLMPFKICNDWFLDYHNILLDKRYILVGKKHTTVKYVYIPSAKYAQSESAIMDFFRSFILHMDLTDDKAYTTDLLRCATSTGANLITIYDYISRDIDKTTQKEVNKKQEYKETPVQPIPVTPVSVKTETPKVEVSKMEVPKPDMPNGVSAGLRPGDAFGKNNMLDDLSGNLFSDDDDEPKKEKKKKVKEPVDKEKTSKGMFGGFFGGKAKGKDDAVAAVSFDVVQPRQTEDLHRNSAGYAMDMTNTGDDATDILGDDVVAVDSNRLVLQLEDAAGYNCPKVIEIDLNKGFATVGRYDKAGNPQGDFNFDASLTFISRRHLRIEKSGDQKRIIDLESGNGTMLNGQPLVANMAYPINPGDKIAISKKHRITYRVC